jgi:hypothetical protein
MSTVAANLIVTLMSSLIWFIIVGSDLLRPHKTMRLLNAIKTKSESDLKNISW